MATQSSDENRNRERTSLVERIQASMDIVTYASRFGELKAPIGTGVDHKGKCILPSHDDKTPSFRVNRAKGVFKCLGCGVGGNVIHLYAAINGMDYEDAKIAFAKELGIFREKAPVREDNHFSRTQRRYVSNLERQRNAMKYLVEERKLTPETIKKMGIGYCWGNEHEKVGQQERDELVAAGIVRRLEERDPQEGGDPAAQKGVQYRDWLAGRITFPVKDYSGQIVAFAGRMVFYEKGVTRAPKYMNGPETELFKKSQILYGVYDATAEIRRKKYVAVVEGYMDVIGLNQVGIGNAVAVMGAQVTSAAFGHIWTLTDRIVFCLDGDAAGENGALRSVIAAAPTMPNTGSISVATLPDGMDPDEYVLEFGADAFERDLCGRAKPLSVVLVDNELKGRELGCAEDRAAFLVKVEKVAELFANAPLVRDQIMREAKARCSAAVIAGAMNEAGVGDASLVEMRNAFILIREAMLQRAAACPDEARSLGLAQGSAPDGAAKGGGGLGQVRGDGADGEMPGRAVSLPGGPVRSFHRRPQ